MKKYAGWAGLILFALYSLYLGGMNLLLSAGQDLLNLAPQTAHAAR